MTAHLLPRLRLSSAAPPPAVTLTLHAINTCTSASALAPLRGAVLREPAFLRSTAVVSAFSLACGRLRHLGPALSLFTSLPCPHVFVFSSILHSLHPAPAPSCSPLPLFRRLLGLGVRPNSYTFPLLFTSLSSLCDLRAAHSRVVKSGFSRDLHVRNALLHRTPYATRSCPTPSDDPAGRCRVDHCDHLIQEPRPQLSGSGHLDDAFRVVETMPSQPNAVIWGLLLRGCKAHGDSWLSEHVMTWLVELEPESASHHVLLSNLYAETGRWQEAEEVLQWMKKKGLWKDAVWSLRMLGDRLSSPEFGSRKLMLPIQGSFVW